MALSKQLDCGDVFVHLMGDLMGALVPLVLSLAPMLAKGGLIALLHQARVYRLIWALALALHWRTHTHN